MAGRPSKYNEEIADKAYSLALLGASDKEMAEILGVSESTFNLWKKTYPEFSESLNEAKNMADSKVVRALYNQAIGGNVTAQIFWLKNRQKDKWRDKQDVDHTVNLKRSADDLSDEELAHIAAGGISAPTGAEKGEKKPH